jgi:threonine dehydratase
MSYDILVGLDEIRAAALRLESHVHRTPVLTSRTLDAQCGGQVFLKCENLQRAGAFKFRGAMNAVLQLDDAQRRQGVITHSSGNHGQALALAGQIASVPVCVVMPRTAPAVKRAACEGYGARIVLCEPTLTARVDTVAREVETRGYHLVHPYDDWRIIAGQATAALELLDQSGPLDLLLTPCGGGGLLSGSALACSALAPSTKLFGVEPANADDARRSLAAGEILPSNDPKTIADGLRTSLGQRTFAVIRRHVSAIVTSTESEILDTMQFVFERLKIVIEPSSAVAVAPVLTRQLDVAGKRVGIILTGGNVDVSPLFDNLRQSWIS